jgi:hypothetical protein
MKSNLLIIALAALVLLLGASFVYRFLHPPITPLVDDASERPLVIQLIVNNASGTPGVAKRTMAYLRERGFDVVELGTSADTLKRSTVIDRVGDRASAVKVAQVLGMADSLVTTTIDSTLFVRASVVIGTDFPSLTPFKQ